MLSGLNIRKTGQICRVLAIKYGFHCAENYLIVEMEFSKLKLTQRTKKELRQIKIAKDFKFEHFKINQTKKESQTNSAHKNGPQIYNNLLRHVKTFLSFPRIKLASVSGTFVSSQCLSVIGLLMLCLALITAGAYVFISVFSKDQRAALLVAMMALVSGENDKRDFRTKTKLTVLSMFSSKVFQKFPAAKNIPLHWDLILKFLVCEPNTLPLRHSDTACKSGIFKPLRSRALFSEALMTKWSTSPYLPKSLK